MLICSACLNKFTIYQRNNCNVGCRMGAGPCHHCNHYSIELNLVTNNNTTDNKFYTLHVHDLMDILKMIDELKTETTELRKMINELREKP